MIPPSVEIILILIVTTVACTLLGVFLVLRRMVLLSDAISHVLLLGIVLAYFLVADLKSPALLIGAALIGLVTVALVEGIQRSRVLKEDAAIGLVFPALFSIGILLASIYFRNTHLDVDSALLGVPELAPSRRLILGSFDCGPYSLVLLGVVALGNLLFVWLFFKELKLTTFDAALAATLGFLPGLLHYILMGLVSLTAVTAFDAVGPVLVVSFIVVPAATAYLVCDRLGWMLVVSCLIGVITATLGTLLAIHWDTNIAGTVASVQGIAFGLVYLLAPGRGWIAQLIRRFQQKREFAETLLLIHLSEHEGTPEEQAESRLADLHRHLRWKREKVRMVARMAQKQAFVIEKEGSLQLTPTGRERVQAVRKELGLP